MTVAKLGYFVLLIPLAALWAGAPATAEEKAAVPAEKDNAIKDVLATNVGGAVCFGAKFKGRVLNVHDESKVRQVPVPGQIENGKQVTRPEPTVYLNQEIRAFTLLLERAEYESSTADELHSFRLKVSMKGWRGPFYALGNCFWRGSDKPILPPGSVAPASGSKLSCNVTGDGGGADVQRVAGSREIVFRLHFGGMRMSSSWDTEGDYRVGADAKFYEEGEPVVEAPPMDFTLVPLPAKECEAFRKATE